MVVTRFIAVSITGVPHLREQYFDYRVPEDYSGTIHVGQLVVVPFGPQQVIGIIRTIMSRSSIPARQLKTYIRLLDLPALPADLCSLADWLQTFYASSPRAAWSTILPSGLLAKARHKISKETNTKVIRNAPVKLSQEQQKIADSIWKNGNQPALIEGITGSGKTHIYEALIDQTLAAGESVIILSPEIFLAGQLTQRLEKRFPGRVQATHSGLTAVARRNVWLMALTETSPTIYLGPRSALFLPVAKLGLIIIDEAHDTSYKQEQAPRYQARDVAGKRAQLTRARLVLGSATPDLYTCSLADQGKLAHYQLQDRHGGAVLPTATIIDRKGQTSLLSPELRQALQETLTAGEQALLLHNRRGTARRLTCENCGQVVNCQNCDVALVYHDDSGRLRCHICNREQFPPSLCPHCNQPELHFRGFGTKHLEHELAEYFPGARLGRIDRDHATLEHLNETLRDAQNDQLDILFGTQMIAKGLDLKNITLVGIINADELLAGTDYQSQERAVSLMMQAAGRAGRGSKAGRVLLQTKQPTLPLLRMIVSQDWPRFVRQELERRKEFHYPPFRYLLRASFTHHNEARAKNQAQQLRQQLPDNPQVEILGPSTPLIARVRNRFTYQYVFKASRRAALVEIARNLPKDWVPDLDPISIL